MPYPSVAIVGRPNVGKSTLFNALVGSRISIEAPVSGVTRDRVLYPLTIEDRTFDLIDCGGIGIVDKQNLEKQVEHQIDLAIDNASVIIFLVNSREGVTPLDEAVADRLRRITSPVLLVANKVDTGRMEIELPSFHSLGFGDAIPVSAKIPRNVGDLEEAILKHLPPPDEDEEPDVTKGIMKIAFVGRRNVGKSTMVNQLCGDERVIVSDIPGTTRDTLDIIIERDGERFVAIDTAGMRKRGKMDDDAEFYSHMRTERAIRRADVVVLMLDITDDISKVDKRIGTRIMESYKPCIIALNKWDLAEERNPNITLDDFVKYINDKLPGMYFFPIAGISAKNGDNVWALFKQARILAAQATRTVATGELNTALANAGKKRSPRAKYGKLGKIYYGTQVETSPPTFVLFVNNPKQFDDNFQRYLCAQLREALGYNDIPLKLIFKASKEKEIGRYK